jgi:diguanylate cyclase (GGDEF)-like protein
MRMKRLSGSWEQVATRRLGALRVDSIRYQLLFFAVVATIVPSFSTAWVSYLQNKRALTDKITSELESVSSAVSRELDLWLKGGLYNIRVFASSYEVTENLDRPKRGVVNLSRLTDYLRSLRSKFPDDFDELLVVDPQGRTVATSAARARPLPLPADWLQQLRADNSAVGPPLAADSSQSPIMVIAVPIAVPSGRFVGAFAARLKLHGVERIARRSVPAPAGATLVATPEGTLIASSHTGLERFLRDTLPPRTLSALTAKAGTAVEYRGFDRQGAVGSYHEVPRLRWAVVSEVPTVRAYEQVVHLRNVTVEIVLALLVGIGLIAWLLSQLIVRPLNRLTQAAAKVAAGDLGVELPVVGGGEVAYLTMVFNAMVVVLRDKTEELELLSTTDGLTGLLNRRRLMEALGDEVRRSQRLEHTFAALMVDVDHFKDYNDAFGHLAGDQVLVTVARLLREQTREVDLVARYGGEEFLVVLPEGDVAEGTRVAERIRTAVAAAELPNRRLTASIGVAEFPAHGTTPEEMLAAADAALYEAKHGGRNRVSIAQTDQPKGKTARA